MLKVKSLLHPFLFINIFLFLILGCGGGGGSSSSRTETFPVKQAFRDFSKDALSYEYSVSGTIDNITVTGSGTREFTAAVAGTFEGSAAFVVTETLTGTVVSQGDSAQIGFNTTHYYDTNYNPIGREEVESYSTIEFIEWPVTVKAGDSGELGIQTVYTDDTKATILGTSEISYSVIAKSSTSVTIEITKVEFDETHDEIGTEVETYTLSNTGELQFIKVHVVDSESDITFEVE